MQKKISVCYHYSKLQLTFSTSSPAQRLARSPRKRNSPIYTELAASARAAGAPTVVHQYTTDSARVHQRRTGNSYC